MARIKHVKRGCTNPDCVHCRPKADYTTSPKPKVDDMPWGWECCTCFHEDVETCGNYNMSWNERCGCGHDRCESCLRFEFHYDNMTTDTTPPRASSTKHLSNDKNKPTAIDTYDSPMEAASIEAHIDMQRIEQADCEAEENMNLVHRSIIDPATPTPLVHSTHKRKRLEEDSADCVTGSP